MKGKPSERKARNMAGQPFYDIVDVNVAEWHELPDGQGPPSQVHMTITVRNIPFPLVMRFKGPETLDKIVAALVKHRNNVWPPKGEPQ
jgi:hypothetical protein